MKKTFFFVILLSLFAAFLWQVGLNLGKYQTPESTEENLFKGYLVWGHEVRSFVPCEENEEYWILGDSPALEDVENNYNKVLGDRKPYTRNIPRE